MTDFQDNSVIVFNSTKKMVPSGPKATNTPKVKEEDGMVEAPPVASFSLKKQICDARIKKGFNQKQLANACNLPVGTIQKYEAGTATINQSELNKMRRVLGAPLSTKK